MAKKRLSKSSLLWFIRSRSYASMSDIRRKFDLESSDEVATLHTQSGRVYVGMPTEYGRMLQDLYNERKIGFEMGVYVRAQSVIGIYTMPYQNVGQNGNQADPTGQDKSDEPAEEYAQESQSSG